MKKNVKSKTVAGEGEKVKSLTDADALILEVILSTSIDGLENVKETNVVFDFGEVRIVYSNMHLSLINFRRRRRYFIRT